MVNVHELLQQMAAPPTLDWSIVPVEARRSFYWAMGEFVADGVHGLWHNPEEVDGHTADTVAFVIGRQFSQLSHAYTPKRTQSPIEDMLLGALLWVQRDWSDMPKWDQTGTGPDAYRSCPGDDFYYCITPQAKVAGHRVDFLVWFRWGTHVAGIAIECDGHAFHEKTKEQAARDKRRDREIIAAGYPVMRFAGSEIYADPVACASHVGDALSGPLEHVSKLAGFIP